MRLIWKKHLLVLIVLGLCVFILSLFIGINTRIGFVQGGIIDGADIRYSLIQILWLLYSIFDLTSSLVIKVITRFTMRWPIWIISYFIGLTSVILILPLIDKYF